MVTQNDIISRMLLRGAGSSLDHIGFLEQEITRWKASKRREEQKLGRRYYRGEHDICERMRKAIGRDGKLMVVHNLPNNRLIDNQYAKMIDQKANYLTGKPLTYKVADNKPLENALAGVFDRRFLRTLHGACKDALIGAVGWLHPCYDRRGNFCFKRFEPEEILPFWEDYEHTVLERALRIYEKQGYEGKRQITYEYVDEYAPEGWTHYRLKDGRLIPEPHGESEEAFQPYFAVGDERRRWGRVPLVAFKYNQDEIPVIRRVKSLQDAMNEILSDFMNNMQEDTRNTVLVLKGHDGTRLDEFRRNLATYGAVKVVSDDHVKGGVETLSISVDAGNYRGILDVLKSALIENARGYDAKDERMRSGNANQMNIQSMYADIDLDANGMETEFQASLEDLLWFVRAHIGGGAPDTQDVPKVEFIFNRDILINENEAIEGCQQSTGIISAETILMNHPWVTDVEAELARVQAEREAALAQYPEDFAGRTDADDGGDADGEATA